MVLTGRFSRPLPLFPWKYRLYVLRKEILGSNKSAPSKLLAPVGECIFDRFWCDFAKQDTNLASESAPKDAKMHLRRAIRFDSRTAITKSYQEMRSYSPLLWWYNRKSRYGNKSISAILLSFSTRGHLPRGYDYCVCGRSLAGYHIHFLDFISAVTSSIFSSPYSYTVPPCSVTLCLPFIIMKLIALS